MPLKPRRSNAAGHLVEKSGQVLLQRLQELGEAKDAAESRSNELGEQVSQMQEQEAHNPQVQAMQVGTTRSLYFRLDNG